MRDTKNTRHEDATMNFLTAGSIDSNTTKLTIITMTATAKSLLAEIQSAKTAKARQAALARFQRINSERVALIEAHGLQVWAATL
jgi:hypothetical protein